MKKTNKSLVLLLISSTILTGCTENTEVVNKDEPVATVVAEGSNYNAVMNVQDLYESLKTNNGGSAALEALLDQLFKYEYASLTDTNDWNASLGEGNETLETVRKYRTKEAFQEDIAENFKNVVEGTGYNDDDGKFDVEKYVKSLTDSDWDIPKTSDKASTYGKYLPTELSKYNFDSYITEQIIPDLLEKYFYQDYLLSSNKYKGQFSTQYAMSFKVLKIDNYTTAENSSWTESMIKDVKAMSTREAANKTVTFQDDYSFVTSNSDGELIVFKSASTGLSYDVYADKAGKDVVENLIEKYETITDADVAAVVASADVEKVNAESWTVTGTDAFNDAYFEKVEDLLIARKLYNIDLQAQKAKVADAKGSTYWGLTKSERSEADNYLSTFTSSNAQAIKTGVKKSKITAQQAEYFTEEDTYTKANYGNVLPSAITALRGSTARELQGNLLTVSATGKMEYYDAHYSDGYKVQDGVSAYLLPYKENLESPVYLDSDYYYVCNVTNWYGYYVGNPRATTSSSTADRSYKSDSNFQITAYQNGTYNMYQYDKNATGNGYSLVQENGADKSYSTKNDAAIIKQIQESAEQILTTSIKKEAVVALFEKYGLTLNDQEIYDYIKSTYPDFFDDED